MHIKFYLDEDVPASLAQALQNRGIDAVTTQAAGNIAASDLAQLLYATENRRVIITHNIRDFILLHKDFLDTGQPHFGIIVSDQLPIGTLLKRSMKLWFSLEAEEMKSRLEFLSSWK